jgi:RND family efflux transporter MFP subunit
MRMHNQYRLVCLLAALTAGAGCSSSAAKGGRTRPPPLVSVATIKTRDVPVEARAPVDLKPVALADISSKTLGYLDAVLVDRGDHVHRGQLLALVRPSDLPDQISALRGTLSQTQANLSLARANAARAKALAPSGIVSQQELESSSSAVSSNEAQEAGIKAQISAIAVRLGETRITSPLDGYVWRRLLDPGVLVGLMTGGTILSVVQIDTMRLFINVNERQAQGIHLGQMAWLEVDALPGRRFEGKVVRIAPVFDPVTRTLEAEVRIPNPKSELKPGMYGRGGIVLEVHKDAPIIPAAAVQVSNDKAFVFVLTGDTVARRVIQTGVDAGEWLEVLKGLKAGDEVVTAGVDSLSDKSRVRVARNVDPYTGGQLAAAGSASAPAPQSAPAAPGAR